MYPTLARAFFILLLVSCTDRAREEATSENVIRVVRDPLAGLVGHWLDTTSNDGTVFHEHWRRTGSGDLEGLGFVLSGRDTVFIEYLGIHRKDSGLTYSARVPSQGHEGPVLFELVHDRDSLVFEAPDHDFPQRIVYGPIGDTCWQVRTSGIIKGTRHEEVFRLVRRGTTEQGPGS